MKQDEKNQIAPEQLEEVVSTEQIDGRQDISEQPANVEKRKGRIWLPYVITTVVLTALTLLFAWAEGGYTLSVTWVMLGKWGSSVSIAGLVGVLVGLLLWVSNGGAFDIFAYGGRAFIHKFKKDVIDRKYRTYYDYREARKAKKRSFWFMAIVGGVFLAVGIVLIIVSNQLIPN